MKQDINTLLQKKMNRRDFLKHLGIGLAAMTGIATVLKTLTTLGGPTTTARGYGANAYGGKPSQSGGSKVG